MKAFPWAYVLPLALIWVAAPAPLYIWLLIWLFGR